MAQTTHLTWGLAATFVEGGKLTWGSTEGDVLGRKIKVPTEYTKVTLKTPLTNRSGISGSVSLEVPSRASGYRLSRRAVDPDVLGLLARFIAPSGTWAPTYMLFFPTYPAFKSSAVSTKMGAPISAGDSG